MEKRGTFHLDTTLGVRLTQVQSEKLHAVARRTGISASEVVRGLLEGARVSPTPRYAFGTEPIVAVDDDENADV